MMKQSLFAFTLTACAALAACSHDTTQPDEYSGFLGDYSRLQEGKSASGAPVLRWVDPSLDAAKYTSVYIEPSQLYPKPQATDKIPQATLQGITNYYDQALKSEFSKSLSLASGPGPNTLVIRPAITAVSSSTQGLRAYEVIPIALVAAAVSTASGIRDEDTSISTEAAFLDADSGTVIAQVVRKGAGAVLENSSQVMTAKDAKAVVDGWASDMYRSYLSLKTKSGS